MASLEGDNEDGCGCYLSCAARDARCTLQTSRYQKYSYLAARIASDAKKGSTYHADRHPGALIELCELVAELHEDLSCG